MAGPQVDLIARPTGATLQVGRSNAALDLAQSLSGVSREMGPLLQNYAKDAQAKHAAKAEADAFANSGAAFADAVRDGKIKRTQNPWYIQSYERSAAAVRGQQEVAQLVQDSGSWASRNNAPEFEKEFTTKYGEIAQKYQGVDQAAGFQSTGSPLLQQTVQQNVQYNVKRIQEEHDQDVSTLATTNILSAVTANGGHPTAAQVYAAIEPQHKQWLETGGTEQGWNTLTINSVIAAGFNSGNAALINVLDDPRDGKGALSNIAGPDGTPVAQTLATVRYRIEQEAASKGMSEIRAIQNRVKLEGEKALQDVWATHGTAFIDGQISKAELVADLRSKGVSPQAIQYALGELAESASKNNSLSRSLMGADPEVLDLYGQANRNGYSPALHARVSEKVRLGEMDLTEAEQIISTATSRSNHLESEARSDARSARSDARADAAAERRLTTNQAKVLKDHRTVTSGQVATALSAAGVKTLSDPKKRAAFDKGLQDAEGTALAYHPGDAAKAREVVNVYAATFLRNELAKKRPKRPGATAPGSSSPNPRR